MRKNRNQRLDLYRCIAVYGVVFLHIMFPGTLGGAINCLARAAVPLFFLSAGYFSFGKGVFVLLRRTLHSAVLLVLACIPPAAIDLYYALGRGETLPNFLRWVLSPIHIKQALAIQVLPFTYAGPLWFLVSMVMIYLLWSLLTLLCRGRALPYTLLAAGAAGALALHLWLGEGRFWRGLPPVCYLYLRNVWLDGLPFFALGAWTHSREKRLRVSARPWMGYGLMILGGTMALWEWKHTDFFDLYLGAVLMALAALAAAVCWPELKHKNPLTLLLVRGGAITFSVYALHIPMLFLVEELAGRFPALAWTCLPWGKPLVVAAAATVLALLLRIPGRLWRRIWGRTA